MKLKLNPLQTRILVHLGTAREMPFDQLVQALMPAREMQRLTLVEWDVEISLRIELLAVYGVIQIVDRIGVRVCVAPDFVQRWADVHRVRAAAEGKKYKPSIVLPAVAAVLLATATAGCSSFPGMKQETPTPAPVVSRYNAERTPPPERMEQFYNARTGSMVYRFCVGDECPLPTPKKPVQRMSVVTETNPDGTTTPVEQNAVFSTSDARSENTAETRKAVREALDTSKTSPKTASNNAAAAAIAAQLNNQRRAFQAAAGVEQSPASPATAPKLSVKTMGAGPAAPAPKASPSVQDNSPVLPATGTRVPSAPSAKANVLGGPVYAQAAGAVLSGFGTVASEQLATAALGTAAAPVGGVAATVLVAETQEKSSGPAAAGSAEAFLASWASMWSTKDSKAYFNLYAKDFAPSYGQAKNLASWEEQRRSVMTRPGAIKVAVEVVKVEERDGKTWVRFWQTYESKSFKSHVLKSFELVKAGNEWKIHRERLVSVDAKASNA